MSANGFLSLLLLLFIGLKLTGYIDWSWWWVLAPFWIPFSIALIARLIYLLAIRFEGPERNAIRALREYAEALRRKP